MLCRSRVVCDEHKWAIKVQVRFDDRLTSGCGCVIGGDDQWLNGFGRRREGCMRVGQTGDSKSAGGENGHLASGTGGRGGTSDRRDEPAEERKFGRWRNRPISSMRPVMQSKRNASPKPLEMTWLNR